MLDRLLDDLRFPIGLLFLIFSVILVISGMVLPLKPDAEMNLNVVSGLMMGVFALFMLVTSVISARAGCSQQPDAK
ncbi:MAG: hypothetical protein WC421_04590 [Elusimicrobiales bacterium]